MPLFSQSGEVWWHVSFCKLENWLYVYKARLTRTGSHPSLNIKVLFVGYSKSELTVIFKNLILWQGKDLFEVFKQLIDTSQQDPSTKSRISLSLGQAFCQCLNNIKSSESIYSFCLCGIRATWRPVLCVSTLCTPSKEFNKLLKSALLLIFLMACTLSIEVEVGGHV